MNAYNRAVQRALATTGHTHLTTGQLAALLDRTEQATPHVQHLQRVHPGHPITRNLLHAAGMTCAQIGLHDGDLEFLDALLQELAHT